MREAEGPLVTLIGGQSAAYAVSGVPLKKIVLDLLDVRFLAGRLGVAWAVIN